MPCSSRRCSPRRARVGGIDLARRLVLAEGVELQYDQLVLALGSVAVPRPRERPAACLRVQDADRCDHDSEPYDRPVRTSRPRDGCAGTSRPLDVRRRRRRLCRRGARGCAQRLRTRDRRRLSEPPERGRHDRPRSLARPHPARTQRVARGLRARAYASARRHVPAEGSREGCLGDGRAARLRRAHRDESPHLDGRNGAASPSCATSSRRTIAEPRSSTSGSPSPGTPASGRSETAPP